MDKLTCIDGEGRGKGPGRFAEALALLLVLPVPLSAATIRLESGCTLADAIAAANSDMATGSCAAGSGADTIELTADVILTAPDNDTDGDNGLPSVISELVLEGNGHVVARDTSDGILPFRLFHIAAVGDLTLRNTTVTGGKARELGSPSVRGGGIFNLGTLALRNTTVIDNSTSVGSYEGFGGGLYNLGQATLEYSTISDNEVQSVRFAEGAGIFTGADSLLSVHDSTISGNEAHAFTDLFESLALAGGGGIATAASSQTLLERTTVTENWVRPRADGPGRVSRAFGGGIANFGSLQLTNSTLYRNHVDAQASGGGNAMSGSGAGLDNGSAAIAELTHVTFADNLIEGPASVQLGSSLNNHLGSLTVTNSVIADSGPSPCIGTIVDGGNNFNALCFPGRPDVAYLGPLANNGGPTQTCQLGGLSNARNAAPGCGVALDQRGVSRPGACDSGAFEINLCTGDDPLETTDSGHDGSDDTCWGNEHPPGLGGFFGVSHRHCDEDWAWFQPGVGKTYEIKTFLLGNGADTEIQLFTDSVLQFGRDCNVAGASDDNSGMGLASRLFYTATDGDEVNIRVTEAFDSYNPGASPPDTVEAYSLKVTCVENCDCAVDGEDLSLSRDIVSTTVTYEACSTLSASFFVIEETADVTFRAGDAVVLYPGVRVRGSLTVEIDPTLRPLP